MSQPLSHSDLLRIIEEYLTSDLTKYASEKDELQTLRRENRELKAQLKREELGHKAYKLLVEIAEETYDIDIRKNFGVK